MKCWKCPECNRVRFYYEHQIIKICTACQIEMEVVDGE